MEFQAPFGHSPPLHVHRTEDEVFHILEGEFRFQVAEEERRYGPGAILLAHKGVPHTYRVESPGGGRFLTVTTHQDFERFVRAMSCPAEQPDLPPASAPSPEVIEALTFVARQHNIDFVGPPLL